jgi:hypothetical protein
MRRTPVSTSDDSQANRTNRRRFLEGLPALGGGASLAVSAGPSPNAAPAQPGSRDQAPLATSNGWYVQDGRAIWGYGLHNDWWGGYRGLPTGWWTDCPLRPSLIRNGDGNKDAASIDAGHWNCYPLTFCREQRESHQEALRITY